MEADPLLRCASPNVARSCRCPAGAQVRQPSGTGSGWKAIAKEIVMLTLTVKTALDRKLAEASQQEGNRQ
jgi:hypothetical protein